MSTSGINPVGELPRPCAFSLRPLNAKDAHRFAEALNDLAIRFWMHGVPDRYTAADALRDLTAWDTEPDEDPDPYWAWALVDAHDRLMGKVGLSDYDGSSANLSYWLHPDARGRGWMTIAVRAVTSSALNSADLGLIKVRACVAVENKASRLVLERVGFKVVETYSDYMMGDGSKAAGLRYALTAAT